MFHSHLYLKQYFLKTKSVNESTYEELIALFFDTSNTGNNEQPQISIVHFEVPGYCDQQKFEN